MTKLAWMDGDTAREVATADALATHAPGVRDLFTVEVDDEVQSGWTRDGETWSAPTAPEDPTPARKRVVDRQEFLMLIPPAKEFAIRAFASKAVDEEDPSFAARGVVSVILARVDSAGRIDLDAEANVQAAAFLVSLDLITQEDADAILAGPIVA